tara:strand:+ start:1956 stop:2384 length:429 start_codon:yes stop_codon:yes gene_type:complete
VSIITSIKELLAPKPAPVVDIGRAPQFDDPDAVEPELLRCYYCQYIAIVHNETTHDGGCVECGSRRMRNVGPVTDEEMRGLIARGFDDSGWQWEPDDARLARIAAKREIDHKFQVKKAVTKEREDNLRKRDRLAGRGPHVLG